MHELGLAKNILESLERSFETKEQKLLTKIFIKVGVRHSVQLDMLQFAYENAVKTTDLAGSKLEIEIINAQGDCPKCGIITVTDQFFICNSCGSFLNSIIGGDQILIDGVEMKEGANE